jgi:hypothetical protein
MFEDKHYKLWGIFGEKDELIGVGFNLEEATQLKKDAQTANYNALKAGTDPEGAQLPPLDELLQTDLGAGIIGDITMGEIGFNAEDVNFLGN